MAFWALAWVAPRVSSRVAAVAARMVRFMV